MPIYTYDVAISFAEEDRPIALKLIRRLFIKYKVKGFYDDYEQARIAGEFLPEYLIDIYKNKAKYCIILISKQYKVKRWARHEWRTIQTRAIEEPDFVYILPVRIDNTELPGLLNSVAYLSLKKLTIGQVADILYSKMSSEIEKLNILRKASEYYTSGNYKAALNLVTDKSLDNEIEALRIRADALGQLHKYELAIIHLLKILEISKNDFLSLFLLGIFYYRISDFKNSVKYYQLAKKKYPRHPTIMSDLPLARKKLKVVEAKKKKLKPKIFLRNKSH